MYVIQQREHIEANETEILRLQKELNEKLSQNEFVKYKEKSNNIHRKIQNDIAEYIQKDAEASIGVTFIK